MQYLLLVLSALLVPALAARLPHIVGGNDVSYPGKWPWQASLQRQDKHHCGAALISSEWLLTAAHCVGRPKSEYTVVLGLHDRTGMTQGAPARYSVSRIYQHPDYTGNMFQGHPNDIAVVKLAEPATLNDFVKPVSLAEEAADFLHAPSCYITGWGNTEMSSGFPELLQEAEVREYDRATCQKKWGNTPIGDYQICVADLGHAGSCGGDSGGPLVCQDDTRRWVLAGVTSFGRSTCSVNYPTIYTRISHFRRWIRQYTRV